MAHGIIHPVANLHGWFANTPATFPGDCISVACDLDASGLHNVHGILPAVHIDLAAAARQRDLVLITIDIRILSVATVLSGLLIGERDFDSESPEPTAAVDPAASSAAETAEPTEPLTTVVEPP
jgi:hypothetical protein